MPAPAPGPSAVMPPGLHARGSDCKASGLAGATIEKRSAAIVNESMADMNNDSFLFQKIQERFPDDVLELYTYRDAPIAVVRKERIKEILLFLRDDPELRFNLLMDLAGVDYLLLRNEPRFEVVYQLYSLPFNRRLRVKAPVDERDTQIDSVTELWPGANWYEREVWDMFGIRFKGHPDLRRLLMYDQFKGHPLRKDYPINRRQPLLRQDTNKVEFATELKPLGRALVEKEYIDESGLKVRHMFLNMGPSHPAMHGVIKIILELDGERVVAADVGIGYLHRAFEKHAENIYYNGVFPYTDRLNYVSAAINNVGYALAVERLLGIDITERCKYVRVIMCELARIADHLTCIGAAAMELGAMTAFIYFMKAREYIYDLIEEVSGGRITISFGRIGGVKADITEDFPDRCRLALKKVRKEIVEVDKLLTRNRIFVDRMQGVGAISAEEAIAYGFTGPLLRACGVEFDVRKKTPYLVYDRLDFDIPIGRTGDNLDRYLVRMEEMQQSIRIIEQALQAMPEGSVNVDHEGKEIPAEVFADRGKFGITGGLLAERAIPDPTLWGSTRPFHDKVYVNNPGVVLPEKEQTYGSIEGLMNHFMLIMEGYGIRPPKGEAYFPVEGANGELGFYVISDGSDKPYRVRVRPPCFPLMGGFHRLIEGDMVADIIPTFGSINMIAGELDR